MTGMRPDLAAIAAHQGGVVLRGQAVQCGYTDDEIARLRRQGQWVRLRRGAYVRRQVYDSFDELGRAALVTRAATLVLAPPAYASHTSAVAIHRLPTFDLPMKELHFTRPSRHRGRKIAGINHHEASLLDSERTTVDGLHVTSLERTPLDIARTFGFVPGVVCADSALYRGADAALMLALATRMTDWNGSRDISACLGFADAGAQSPGESLSRIAVVEAGLPAPRTQFEVHKGDFLAFADLAIPGMRLLLEFDGRMKYRRRRDPTDPVIDDGDIVWAEKEREDVLRELGWDVVRIIWGELFGPRRILLLQRLRRAAARAGRPHRPAA
ncbi:MAG: hypothetical protein GEU96_06105 [Propionibacteriales bacterium]|nr:hypothetical protein [Propionibacteriales bacterium]